MNEKTKQRRRPLVWLLLLAFALAGVAGCADDSEESGPVTVPLQDLQRQIGYSDATLTNSVTSPTSDETNPATSVARSIAIGAVVVRSRSLAEGPYSDETPIENIETQLEDDIRNSAAFINLINLPTAEEAVTVDLPPPAAEKWQLLGAALSTQPANKEALGEPANQDATIYIGFDKRFLATTSEGGVVQLNPDGTPGTEPLTDITLTLQRACLQNQLDPPKGCAQFNTDGNIIVSAALEIVDVEVNGVSVTGVTFPIIVRDAASVGTARVALFPLFNPLTDSTHTSVEVFTTHQLAPNQSAACAAAAATVADLEANCGVESYFTPAN
jgi:hypothetical protein